MEIIKLPNVLANKIAAGEVVERPASVVKELVENSIDAESTFIRIEVKEAGIKQIKVIDNGTGMTEKNLEKAFERHATSKIKEEQDLYRIETLGFRGEALSSIASVSQLIVRSSTGEKIGNEFILEEGKIVARNKTTARKGTEIIVNQLFFNTPARLKHIKTIHTELGHITDVVNREALSYPHIRFELVADEKLIFNTFGDGKLLHVIAQIYGREVSENMLFIENENLDFHLKGYIAKPEITRANRSYMTFILNNRYVKNFRLSKAILDAYHTLLTIHRYPIAVIEIKMDPILVDVNVHPTKLEVRLSKEEELVKLLQETIKNRLNKERLIPNIELDKHIKKDKQFPTQTSLSFTNNDFKEKATENFQMVEEKTRFIREKNKDSPPQDKIDVINEAMLEDQTKDERKIPYLDIIGQFQGTYIMAQNEKGLYLIDQHAAQERIKYEYFKDKLSKPENEEQSLLIPIVVQLTKQEALQLESYLDQLRSIGIFIENFGQNSFIIRSHPTWFPKENIEGLIREIIDYCLTYQKIDLKKLREETAILLSCKRSIKANHYLKKEDMEVLINDLRKTESPYTCPHGRPVVIHLSTYEIEKMFKRIM